MCQLDLLSETRKTSRGRVEVRVRRHSQPFLSPWPGMFFRLGKDPRQLSRRRLSYLWLLVTAETMLFVNTLQDSQKQLLQFGVHPPAPFPTRSSHVIKKKCEEIVPKRPPQEFNGSVRLKTVTCRKYIYPQLHISKDGEVS